MCSVFAVVVTYNGMRWLDRCLGSLANSDTPVNTIVIDNASTDGTPDYIAEHFPSVHLVRSDINYGFAKANNIGIKYALDNGADYVFLLNQDAWVESDTISKLLETFVSRDQVGIVSPMHMNGEETNLDWKFATNLTGEFISDCFLGKLNDSYQVKYVNAAAWMINRQCLQTVGGFDTNLFIHYGEDIDYTHRLRYWNLLLLVNPKAIIYHDREFRKGNDDEYKQRVFKRDSQIHNMKLDYGDINVDWDINRIIRQIKFSIIKKIVRLKFSEIKRKRIFISTLRKVMISRNINKQGNGAWLYE